MRINIFKQSYDTETMSNGQKSMLAARVKLELKSVEREMEQAMAKLDQSRIQLFIMKQAKLDSILKYL